MRAKASILTILVFVLVAGNALALPSTSLQVTTDFIGWTNPNGSEAASRWLHFSSEDWWVDGSTSANQTGGGSMRGFSMGAAPTVNFERGADEFYFTYTGPTYVTINMADAIFDTSNPFFDPTTYANAFYDDYTMTGFTDDTITYYLNGSTQWDAVTESWVDAGFYFYANDGEDYLSILSLAFTDYDPSNPPLEPNYESQMVELTNLHYNPTATPIPGAAWLLGSGLIGLVGLRRRFKA